MSNFFNKLGLVFKDATLRKRILFVFVALAVFRLLAVIPIPGVNTTGLAAIIEGQKGLSFFSALMGGGLSNFSIILMGLSPYINAVIIIQLLGVIIPRIWDMQKEGEQGQRKIIQIQANSFNAEENKYEAVLW